MICCGSTDTWSVAVLAEGVATSKPPRSKGVPLLLLRLLAFCCWWALLSAETAVCVMSIVMLGWSRRTT